MGGGRGLVAIVVGVIVVVVTSVAVVLVAGDRPPPSYPAGSPEAALQAYLKAWDARDFDATWASFSTAARRGTTQDDYRQRAQDYSGWADPPTGPSRRVFIDRTTVSGDRATLDLTVEETWIQGLSVSRNRSGRIVTMAREDGGWRFDRLFVGLEPEAMSWK
jgi:hypothetical protein